MFGYAFESGAKPDRIDRYARAYRPPQSLYFSGYPLAPANAPIVSQNYTNFAMIRPDPKKTWDIVSNIDPKTLPVCQLFQPPSDGTSPANARRAPTWGDIKRGK